MLTVDQFELIRRKHFIDGMSRRAIARELGHSRKTIKKALQHPVPPGYQRTRPVSRPVMDRFAGIVDAWLEEDHQRPRKQRHTARRIYERLRDEHGFPGSASTVRRYVAKAEVCQKEVFMPLAYEPGEEAQVDWHDGWIIVNGAMRKAQFFCMRLSYSKAPFVRAYERANMASFLDGHVRALAYFGGVPKRLAYDNLRSAVIQVGKGRDRRLNKRFIELRSWYLFDTRFCNVAKGNEKGDVENLAKRSQRTYLTPIPQVSGLADLNAHLLLCCEQDLERTGPRPHQDRTQGQLLEEERRCLLPLPERPFEPCQRISTVIDKRSLVTIQTNSYSAPVRWAHHPVLVKAFVDRVELWCDHQQVAVHEQCYEKGQFILEPTHYLNLLKTKPGSLDNARAFKGMFKGQSRGEIRGRGWGEDFDLLRRELEYRYGGEGTRKFINVLLLFAEHPEDQVREAVSRCVHRRAFSDEAVIGVLRNQPPEPRRQLDLSGRPELVILSDGIRSAGLYDQLRSVEEEVAA